MTSPFFSILLPTKNRAHLVGRAVRSVLLQEYGDFELIICDNDDDPNATKNALKEFLGDPRVHYIRTGGLNMIDNWNVALDTASGEYVTVLEDKMIFYPGSLGQLSEKINESPTGVVVWGVDFIQDDFNPPRLEQFRGGEDRIWGSDEVLGRLRKDIMGHWSILPRGLASVLPASVIDAVRDKFGGKFYQPLSPDFVSALKTLLVIDRYLVTGDAYNLVISNKVSNGKAVLTRKHKDHSYWQGRDEIPFDFDLVPVKSKMIVANALVIDYRNVMRSRPGGPGGYLITHSSYLEMMVSDLLKSTISARRIVWNSKEIIELLRSEDSVFRNIIHIFRFISHLIFRRMRSSKNDIHPNQLKGVSELDQDALSTVDSFLAGRNPIGSVESYPPNSTEVTA